MAVSVVSLMFIILFFNVCITEIRFMRRLRGRGLRRSGTVGSTSSRGRGRLGGKVLLPPMSVALGWCRGVRGRMMGATGVVLVVVVVVVVVMMVLVGMHV